MPDLAVHETVGYELEDLELASCRFLLELAQGGRRGERNDRARPIRVTTRSSRLEAAAVVTVPRQDLPALCGVHAMRIGARRMAL